MLVSLLLILVVSGMPIQDGAAVRQSEADFARGVALQQRGDLQQAREAYEAALRSVPNRADALSNLGVIFARLGQYGEAIHYYKEALAVDEKQYETRLNLGIAFYKTEEFELALRELSQVAAAQPDNYQARLLLGVCDYQLNKLKEAVVELEAVHNAQPDNVAAAFALGNAYLGLNETEKAEPLVKNVFGQLNSAEAHLIVGSFYLAVKDFPKAIEELNQAKELNSRLPTLHSQLGEANLFSGNREQAAKEFAAELEINPRDYNANVRLGWIYREDGRLDEAAPLLKKALDLRPNDIASLYQMAQLATAKGETAEAVRLLERVTTRSPEFTPAHVLLARLYYKLNRAADGQRERDIIQKLQEEQQKKQVDSMQQSEPAKSSAGEVDLQQKQRAETPKPQSSPVTETERVPVRSTPKP
jgi:tetratricopeptide (TPR) repeat protein